MIFNCLNCCKAISSKAEQCPFCMIETVKTVAKIKKETPELLNAPVKPRDFVDAATRRPGSLLYSAVAHIGDVVRAMRAPKTS